MRVLIVDDEAPARRKLKRFVNDLTSWRVAGEARSVASAIEAIESLTPDLVLLDIRLGDGTGFDVLKGLETCPRIVFVTAYDEYAVKAFEVHAQDYLLKPVDRERFKQCVRRLESTDDLSVLNDRLQRVLGRTDAPPHYLRRIYVERGERGRFLPVDQVSRLVADRNYVVVHSSGEQHRIRETLSGIASQLDPQQFAQANRSTIVNMDAIAEVQTWFRGERLLILTDGTQVRLGRAFLSRSPALQSLR